MRNAGKKKIFFLDVDDTVIDGNGNLNQNLVDWLKHEGVTGVVFTTAWTIQSLKVKFGMRHMGCEASAVSGELGITRKEAKDKLEYALEGTGIKVEGICTTLSHLKIPGYEDLLNKAEQLAISCWGKPQSDDARLKDFNQQVVPLVDKEEQLFKLFKPQVTGFNIGQYDQDKIELITHACSAYPSDEATFVDDSYKNISAVCSATFAGMKNPMPGVLVNPDGHKTREKVPGYDVMSLPLATSKNLIAHRKTHVGAMIDSIKEDELDSFILGLNADTGSKPIDADADAGAKREYLKEVLASDGLLSDPEYYFNLWEIIKQYLPDPEDVKEEKEKHAISLSAPQVSLDVSQASQQVASTLENARSRSRSRSRKTFLRELVGLVGSDDTGYLTNDRVNKISNLYFINNMALDPSFHLSEDLFDSLAIPKLRYLHHGAGPFPIKKIRHEEFDGEQLIKLEVLGENSKVYKIVRDWGKGNWSKLTKHAQGLDKPAPAPAPAPDVPCKLFFRLPKSTNETSKNSAGLADNLKHVLISSQEVKSYKAKAKAKAEVISFINEASILAPGDELSSKSKDFIIELYAKFGVGGEEIIKEVKGKMTYEGLNALSRHNDSTGNYFKHVTAGGFCTIADACFRVFVSNSTSGHLSTVCLNSDAVDDYLNSIGLSDDQQLMFKSIVVNAQPGTPLGGFFKDHIESAINKVLVKTGANNIKLYMGLEGTDSSAGCRVYLGYEREGSGEIETGDGLVGILDAALEAHAAKDHASSEVALPGVREDLGGSSWR